MCVGVGPCSEDDDLALIAPSGGDQQSLMAPMGNQLHTYDDDEDVCTEQLLPVVLQRQVGTPSDYQLLVGVGLGILVGVGPVGLGVLVYTGVGVGVG